MISIFLCVAAFVFSYVAGRRSLIAGLITVMTVGYFYGILRANVIEIYSHFIFDAAVLGLYVTQLLRPVTREERRRQKLLRLWVMFLIAWPFLLFFVPVQDYAVQLVGLRGNIFLLPFILLGARLREGEVYKLAFAFAFLNIIAFGFALAEYVLGVDRFFPESRVTELIYRSVVDENFSNPDRTTALRIPSIFTGAHAFAATMVLTFPFLFGVWVQRAERLRWHRILINVAMVVTVVGVFMAAARSPVIILALMLAVTLFSRKVRVQTWAIWLVVLMGIGWIVSSEERLQRFMTLKDVDFVSERIYWSVNESFFDLITEYPMGNGLGGGGTSMPYFLQGLVIPPTAYMENEYARILLEQGTIGLCLWVTFVLWALMRPATVAGDKTWLLGRRLLWVACAAFFATGMIGRGLLTSIPGTALLLLALGWITVRQPSQAVDRHAPVSHGNGPASALARQYG